MIRSIAFVLLAVATAASAQSLFKYRTADGRIIYSDRSVAGATLLEEFDRAPPPDPAAMSAADAAARARAKEVRARAGERVRALDAVSAEIASAEADLARARAALVEGREPLEGERTGTFAGKARLNDAYWARQRDNEYAIAEAQARLDSARQALIQLR
jgi:hypothetical protein